MGFKKFPFYKQLDVMDCGPTCLRMVAKYHGKSYSLQSLREKCHITREGVSLLGISDAAETIGLKSLSAKLPFDKLDTSPTPFIAYWRQKHFLVVYKVHKGTVWAADPSFGRVRFSKSEFMEGWLSGTEQGEDTGVILLLEPTPAFYEDEGDKTQKKIGFSFLFRYLRPYKSLIIQLIIGMLTGSLLQLILPFLTQSIVDVGIRNLDISFVTMILVAQVMFYFSSTMVGFIRSWILLHLGTRINISILSDFLIKLMKLPISYFDAKMIGDLMQRMGDHKRIETFLTSSTLNTLFSFINLVIFGFVLAFYSLNIFLVFLLGSAAYIVWILLFLRKRRALDHKRFDQLSANQSNVIQLINGMQEIKLHNSEKTKRWEWERIQARLFKVKIKGLVLDQYQEGGSMLINELKNIFIAYLAAKSVIDGEITLGMMLAVQYITGQLNAPIRQFVGFIHMAQDAKISLERLGEIHGMDDEEDELSDKSMILLENQPLNIQNLSFQYEGPHSEFVLKNINLTIPEGKVTAIVGASGSGKTTLMKLLLKFYKPIEGEVRLGSINLENISSRLWREQSGAVLQGGFIFSDSIANNIAVGDEYVDKEKLRYAVKTANIQEFIESLPLGYNTKIGSDGHGLSQGQRQRLLIARAVYKNPQYLYFDEATNALDANNEKVIMENLNRFFENKTVIVIAHRLSTVKNADQIVVLDKGKITETGTHEELTNNRGGYYKLVKNQLELGN